MKHQPEDQPKNQYEATGTQYSLITKDLCLKEKDRKRLLSPPPKVSRFHIKQHAFHEIFTAPEAARGCDTNLSDFADHVFIRPTGVLLQGIGKTPFELTFRKKQKGRAVPLYQMTWNELIIYKDLLTNISTGTIGTAMTYSCFHFFLGALFESDLFNKCLSASALQNPCHWWAWLCGPRKSDNEDSHTLSSPVVLCMSLS